MLIMNIYSGVPVTVTHTKLPGISILTKKSFDGY